jgi:predicted nuclease with TOPRIM domain
LPGLEQREAPRGRADLAAENAALCRAFGEIASENAELHKRVGKLTAELELEKARHDAWAKEMSVRDRMRSSREEALTSRVEDLERRLAQRPDTTSTQPLPGRLETSRRPQARCHVSNGAVIVSLTSSSELALRLGWKH